MKKLALLLTLLLLVSLFAACTGGTPTTAAPTTAASAADAPVTDAPAAEAPTTAAPTVPQVEEADVHPLLYHVTGPDGQEGWLFGTIHVGDERIQTALEKLTPILGGCDALAVEFDVVAYEQDYAAQMQAMSKFILTDGTKASDHMSPETFEKASALLGEAGLRPSLMQAYNLAMWAQLVEQAALMTRTSYSTEIGMDRSLIRYCYDHKIEVRDVESAELQYKLLAGFSDELNLLLIEEALEDLDSFAADTDKLYNTWLKGNPVDLLFLVAAEEGGDYTETEQALLKDYYDKMLTQRNIGMRDRALEWLKAGDKVFFAVGAAHLLGMGGLAALLQAEGFTVELYEYN